MDPDRREPPALAVDALIAQARLGGPDAALTAKRAAVLAERLRPNLAREALALAARLDPRDPNPKLDLARLHAEQGELEQAAAAAASVLGGGDQPARARAAFLLGEIARMQGDGQTARAHFTLLMQIEDGLLAADRGDPIAARWYARGRGRIAELDAAAGDQARARSGAEGALAMLRATASQIGEPPVLAADIADAELRLAVFELEAGEPNSARRRAGEAIGRYEALAVTEKDEPHWRDMLARAWTLAAQAAFVAGAGGEAHEAMDKALQARIGLAARHAEEAWALAATWRVRAGLLAGLGDTPAAEDSLNQAAALARRLHELAPDQEAPARFLVHTLLEQADHALRTGGGEMRAKESADAARALAQRFAAAGLPGWCGEAAAAWDRLGEVCRRAGATPKQTQDAFARAVEFRRMELSESASAASERALAAALGRLGEAALQAGANSKAREALEESAALQAALFEAAPDDPRAGHALAATLDHVGLAAFAMTDMPAARAAWEHELRLFDHMHGEDEGADVMRLRATVEARLAGARGPDCERHRDSALARLDALARAGALSEQELTLRRKLRGR